VPQRAAATLSGPDATARPRAAINGFPRGICKAMTDRTRELLAPAKINLILSITGRRADGYHELATLMVCIDLFDRITLRFAGTGIRLTCNTPDVPQGETNLAFRAARLYHTAYQRWRSTSPFDGLAIRLDKTIPIGAGLGGGSSNAAAILKALNNRMPDPLPPDELAALALQLGADVPFFLKGRPALATGIGEHLTPWPGLAPYALLVVFPGKGLATGEIYGALNLRLTKCEKKLKELLLKRDFFDVAAHLCNDLEAAALRRCPDIALIKRELVKAGALGALMSGSGSSVFGLFRSADEARKARRRLKRRPEWKVFQASLMV
jgi:4-diphosphocytidyl-2-C-methyl-D-erythritol kinase